MTMTTSSLPTPAAAAQSRGEGRPFVNELAPGSLAPAAYAAAKYTVVIPTRNRQRYAVQAAQSALLSGRDDIQVIVADNSDDETVMPRLLDEAGILDRVTFLEAQDDALPMKLNWERTLDYAAGEWIGFIGDDDGFLVDAFDALDFLTTAFKSHVFNWRPGYYKWPCFPECDRGVLTLPYEEIGVTFTESMKVLQAHCDWITQDKWPHAGPSIYHGMVHRDLISATRLRYGRYFLNAIVDYSCAITNCTFIDYSIQYRWPITIMGACGDSNTAGLTANGTGKKKVEQLRSENPDFKAVYPGFEDTRLMAAWVAAGYASLFEELGLPFNITPGKFSKSMINELGRIRDLEIFETERSRIRAFMLEHGLDTGNLDKMRCVPTMKMIGLNVKPMQLLADTRAFGWTGILDVVSNLDSLRQGLAHSVTGHGQLVEKTEKANPAALRENAHDAYKVLGRVAARALADLDVSPLSAAATCNTLDAAGSTILALATETETDAEAESGSITVAPVEVEDLGVRISV